MITVTIEPSVFVDKLKSKINDPNAEAIAKTIITNLNMHGLNLLYNALDGYVPKIKFNIGQTVYVPVKELCGWRFKLEDQVDLVQGIYKLCTIVDINPYSQEPVTVETTMHSETGADMVHRKEIREKDIRVEDYG